MNVFALDEDPKLAARFQCDVHVTKMCSEAGSILCTAATMMEYPGSPYEPYRESHDVFTRWASESRANWDWLVEHGVALVREHMVRRGTSHRSLIALAWARSLDPYEHFHDKDGALTAFPDGTFPKLRKSLYPDPSADTMVQAYRMYYGRKEEVWAKRAKDRILGGYAAGSKRPSKGFQPIMTWSSPSSRPDWMPGTRPSWQPTRQEVDEAGIVPA